jgi:hypothetical protein
MPYTRPRQKGGEEPVRQRSLALVQQDMGEVVEGALAALAPGAFALGAVVVRAPASNVMALAPRTWQRTIFPPQYMEETWHCSALKSWCKCERTDMTEHLLVS